MVVVGNGGGSAWWWWRIPKMMVGWSDGGAPSAQAVLLDADAVTGAQRDPTQLDLTSHIRSRIKRRGLGKWSACACVVVSSPSRPCLTREYREQGESDARGGQSAESERKILKKTRCLRTEGRKTEGSWSVLVDNRVRERPGTKVIVKGREAAKVEKKDPIPPIETRIVVAAAAAVVVIYCCYCCCARAPDSV